MRIIAIVNQKGGVGKTTTTINLGAALIREGRKVLIIDLDPQANLSYSLGFRSNETTKTMYDVLKGTAELSKCIVKHNASGLDFVPADIDMTASELELSSQAGRELILTEELKQLAGAYDYVLIDCAPSLGILTLNALVAAKEVLIPLQTQYLAMQGMSKLIETLDLIKRRLNPDINVTGIVGTMYDSRKNLPGEVVEAVRQTFGDKLFTTLIRDNVSLAEAPSYSQDIFSYKPTSNGADDYAALAKELMTMEVNTHE
jgi:chromosome partitioning protein